MKIILKFELTDGNEKENFGNVWSSIEIARGCHGNDYPAVLYADASIYAAVGIRFDSAFFSYS
ncbi:hypothetical protein PghCCS26_41800 [Paenibacillus glycanilyticus]|uniref:Uncharacterized protein n=1 Tax=Paenibacillus glycanilyticus TaxID=126569 RepID=A0ABQ6NPP5_9BACL|nr:hypothetical protein PghCCS26_41800 [Paenibacillus glycanilyticus]